MIHSGVVTTTPQDHPGTATFLFGHNILWFSRSFHIRRFPKYLVSYSDSDTSAKYEAIRTWLGHSV
jgi:hypothetical protein